MENLRRIAALFHAGIIDYSEAAKLIVLSEPDPEIRLRMAEEWLSSDSELISAVQP